MAAQVEETISFKRKGKTKALSQDLSKLPERTPSAWKVGAHVSAAGGVENSVINAAKIGYVTSFKQTFSVREHRTSQSQCIRTFSQVSKKMGLPCSQRIKHRVIQGTHEGAFIRSKTCSSSWQLSD